MHRHIIALRNSDGYRVIALAQGNSNTHTILSSHYASPELAEDLIAEGDIDTLDEIMATSTQYRAPRICATLEELLCFLDDDGGSLSIYDDGKHMTNDVGCWNILAAADWQIKCTRGASPWVELLRYRAQKAAA